MSTKLRTWAALVAALSLAAPLAPLPAAADGMWPTWSIVGGSAFCGSFVSGVVLPNSQGAYGVVPGSTQGTGSGICGQTVPAGPPSITGEELIPLDINTGGTASGGPVQSAVVPSSLLGNASNRIIGGDFTTNLAQRLNTAKGVTALATLSPTAAVMTADRWWVIAPAAGVTATIDSTASTAVVPALNNTKALRIARTTSGAAGIVCVGQTLDSAASLPLIGSNAVFSFYEENGATQSATNGNITVNVDYTSAADAAATQATLGFAGANGSLFALGDVGLLSAGPTNMTRAVAGVSTGTTGTVAAGVATIPASATWTRYAVYAPIPVTVPGTTTPVTSVSVSICWTPTATTAVATDYIEIEGAQLEAKPSAQNTQLPAGVISPTSFERRLAPIEALYQEAYWYFNYENQSAITTVATCENTATTAANCLIPWPVQMRIAPLAKFTAGFQAFAQVAETSVSACSALALSSTYATVTSTTGALVQCTATVGAAGTANQLTTLGTSSATGIISASAEP